MEEILIHRKQFLISKEKYERDDFRYIYLENNLILSYQKELKIKEVKTFIGKAYILGVTFQVKNGKKSPEEELKNLKNQREILNILSTWSGRYIVILNNKIYTDFSGNLGCFYSKNVDNFYISSSLGLLKEKFNINEIKHEKIEHGIGMDFYPSPVTILENVYRLLPSEILNFGSNGPLVEFRNYFLDYSWMKKEEIFREFIECFSNLLFNISKEYNGKLFLPLTGGVDSRTILAFLLNNNIEFTSYIMQRRKGLSSSDLKIGRLLSEKFKFKHFILKEKEKNKNIIKKREKMLKKHNLGTCVDENIYFFKNNFYSQLDFKNGIILRGAVWEITMGYTEEFESFNTEYKLDKMKAISSIYNLKKESFQYKSLEEWTKSIENNTINIDWRVRFYLEQRVASWLSDIEQSEDILEDIDIISPINSQYLINLLWALPKEMLTNDKIGQKQIIEEVFPKVLEYSFNKMEVKDRIKGYFFIIKQTYKEKGMKALLKKIWRKLNG